MSEPLFQEVLQKLPDKRKPTLKQLVEEHLSDINSALSRGYTYRELTNILKDEGIEIACSTLKKYVQQLNRATKQPQLHGLPLPKLR